MIHWSNPLLVPDSHFDESWTRKCDDPVLFVVGSGFDPRATVVLERLVSATDRCVDALLVELPEGLTDLAVRPRAIANRERIQELINAAGGQVFVQPPPDVHDNRSLGRLISRHFQASDVFAAYTEIVLEISAIPRSVFFPLIRGMLERAHLPESDPRSWTGDLHVAVCENPEIDASILEEGTTPMAHLGGFARRTSYKPSTTIWVPVLGERAAARVETLYDELEPDETCPVLPWPAKDPRRGDCLVLEYRSLLFEKIRLEPRNIIHAAERNPFDLYRTLGALQQRYRQSLSPLGDVAVVLSSHSSKLLSVGVLLTAYEHGLEVQHVSPGTYGLHPLPSITDDNNEIYDLWLTGQPYR